ncbi:endonuclease/exonuclease/phosphatase family protein [Candidatus Parcubacteria bacterium]|nr:endonuclease/exonuclease/phosphatase family protein [Candidatus Parcubacteria bacterium]
MAQFSILTLNLRHGQGPRVAAGEAPWSFGQRRATMRAHAAAIGSFIGQMTPQPDIVCLQETNAAAFFWPDILSIIRERSGYQYVAASPQKVLPHNNGILSRFPFNRVVSRQFRKLPMVMAGWRAICYSINRGFVAAEIEGVGTVVSTHLDPYVPALRFGQARELRQALPARNIIITGDFNPLTWDEESLKVAGEGLTTAPPIDAEHFASFATWPAPLETQFLTGPAGVMSTEVVPECRLDYVLVSPGLRFVSAERVFTGHTDHYGVVVTVERRSP